jgi:hypothetical protein
MQRHVPILFENIPEETIRWGKNYCAVENIQIIAEGGLFNVYTTGALTVLYNHHYITVCNATEMLITVFTIASYSFLS